MMRDGAAALEIRLLPRAKSPGRFASRWLVPRPRLPPILFPGVLAPDAKLRALVVPQGPQSHGYDDVPARAPLPERLRRRRALIFFARDK
jgi:hypothetical protein